MRAAIYARADNDRGIELQLSQCRLLIDVEDWQEVDTYIDRGYSGMTLDRPELGRLLMDASGGRFDRVVVASPTRIARNLADIQTIEQELEYHGVELVTVEPRHEVPHG